MIKRWFIKLNKETSLEYKDEFILPFWESRNKYNLFGKIFIWFGIIFPVFILFSIGFGFMVFVLGNIILIWFAFLSFIFDLFEFVFLKKEK